MGQQEEPIRKAQGRENDSKTLQEKELGQENTINNR